MEHRTRNPVERGIGPNGTSYGMAWYIKGATTVERSPGFFRSVITLKSGPGIHPSQEIEFEIPDELFLAAMQAMRSTRPILLTMDLAEEAAERAGVEGAPSKEAPPKTEGTPIPNGKGGEGEDLHTNGKGEWVKGKEGRLG